MKNEEKYRALLQANTSENNLLTIQLIQSQLNWDLEKTLHWVVSTRSKLAKNEEDIKLIYLGAITLSLAYTLDDGGDPWIGDFNYLLMLEYKIIKDNKTLFECAGNYIEELDVYVPDMESYLECILKDLDKIIPELAKQFVINQK